MRDREVPLPIGIQLVALGQPFPDGMARSVAGQRPTETSLREERIADSFVSDGEVALQGAASGILPSEALGQRMCLLEVCQRSGQVALQDVDISDFLQGYGKVAHSLAIFRSVRQETRKRATGREIIDQRRTGVAA